MAWSKIDDLWLGHPKVRTAGPLGELLHMRSIVWCSRHLTDGVIPRGALDELMAGLSRLLKAEKLTADALIKRLLKAKLWERHAEGYAVHDYLVYNPTAAKEEARLQGNAARQKSFRDRRRNGQRNALRNGQVTPAPSPFPCLSDEKDLSLVVEPGRPNPGGEPASTMVEAKDAGASRGGDPEVNTVYAKYREAYEARWRQPAPLEPDDERRLERRVRSLIDKASVDQVIRLVQYGATQGTKYQREKGRYDLGAIIRMENWACLQNAAYQEAI